jgi:hypothetical protein
MLKVNCEDSFTNMVLHEESGQNISVPPEHIGQSTWSQEVLKGLKQEVSRVVENTYGKEIAGIVPEGYRMCW